MTSDVERWLLKRNVRPTAVRILVLEYFIHESSALSLTQLEEYFTYADKSTLFRTLKTFEKHSIIHTIEDGSGFRKYGLCEIDCDCLIEDQHFHFHCHDCKKTYCLDDQRVPEMQLPENFSFNQANLVLKGRCANCN